MPNDAMVHFSIAPTSAGAWVWRTTQHGRVRSQGIAPSKKFAAALIVKDIVAARRDQALLATTTSAKAA